MLRLLCLLGFQAQLQCYLILAGQHDVLQAAIWVLKQHRPPSQTA